MLKYVFIAVYPNLRVELKKPSINCEHFLEKITTILKKVHELDIEHDERVPFNLRDELKLFTVRFDFFLRFMLFSPYKTNGFTCLLLFLELGSFKRSFFFFFENRRIWISL